MNSATGLFCKGIYQLAVSCDKEESDYTFVTVANRTRIFKHLWSPGTDSKEWIPPAYVAWRAGTITLFLLGAYIAPRDCLKIPAQS
jgi:hypothetical protein